MALGLTSTSFGSTPNSYEPCDCEVEEPCYQAVYTLGSSICEGYGAIEVPESCNGDSEAFRSACACIVPNDTTSTETQSLGTDTEPTTSTTYTTNECISPPTTHGMISTSTDRKSSDSTTSDNGSYPLPGPSFPTTSTGTKKFQTNTDSSTAQTDSRSVPAGYETTSTKSETRSTAPAETGTVVSSGDVFTTPTKTGGYKEAHSTVSYTTKIVYTTAVNTYTKSVDLIKGCSSGSQGLCATTETSAISTIVYPITEQSPPAPTHYAYTTKAVYSTETYVVTKCHPSVSDCPYGSTTTSTYPVSTVTYRAPETQSPETTGYNRPSCSTIYSTIYITQTFYSTNIYTVTQHRAGASTCVCDSSLAETIATIASSDTTITASNEKSLTHSTNDLYNKANYPALFEEADATFTASTLRQIQPSDVISYQQATAIARAAEVTGGASRLSVKIVAVVGGIFVPMI
ncbi:hypothetical protein IL306_005209 [Fusarium sp. DS 682]|nr:hypothetical protein IL306_005209 [Fusarium sp. DS 682]